MFSLIFPFSLSVALLMSDSSAAGNVFSASLDVEDGDQSDDDDDGDDDKDNDDDDDDNSDEPDA